MAAQSNRVVVLDRKEALRRAGNITKSTEWWLSKNDPTFPQKVHLSPRRVGYYEHEWSEWLATRRHAAVARMQGQDDSADSI